MYPSSSNFWVAAEVHRPQGPRPLFIFPPGDDREKFTALNAKFFFDKETRPLAGGLY